MTELNLEKGIFEELPQIPYVIDQVGDAIKWAKEDLSEGEYNKVMEIAYDVAKFTKSISEPNFFKTHLVLASILSYIPKVLENEKFSRFDTASKATENTIKKICVPPAEVEKHGCFKASLLQLVPLAKEDENIFAVVLIGIKHELKNILKGMEKANIKEPITAKDYISILGYAFMMANVRMANLCLLNRTYEIYNEVTIILNEIKF